MNSMLKQRFSTEFDIFNEEMTPREISSVKLSVIKNSLIKNYST